MGVDYQLFWHINPYKLKSFEKAYKIRRDIADEQMWIQGAYIENAFGVVLSNAFGGKNSKKAKYLDKPFSKQQKEEELLTDEQRKAQIKNLFTMLSVKKTNFDIEKKNKAKLEGNT